MGSNRLPIILILTALALDLAVAGVGEGAIRLLSLGIALALVGAAWVCSRGKEAGQDSAEPAANIFDHALFKAAPVGIARLDVEGRMIDCNPALAEMVGLSGQISDPRALSDFVIEDEKSAVKAALQAAATNPANKPLEATIEGQRRRIVSLHIAARTDASSGHAAEQIVHMIDVTAFKDLESQILQSRKMQAVGQLAGGIAHDFNNLLTAMIGFCDLLLLRHRAGDQSFADIMQIKQNANRAASLVRQLLAFSRQQTLRPRVLDITETLTELSHLLRRLIGQTVALKLEHGRDLGLVKVDQGQFEQVVINLAVNARDAMPNGGTLTIRTENMVAAEPVAFAHETMPAGAYIRIDVVDSGTGIPDEVLGRIFEPFFTTKPVGSGTGLGLSTVHGIVRQTDGYVAVDSELGRGTVFTIYLPRYSGPQQVEERNDDAERPESDTTGTGTILLVEDEDPVRLFTARALRNKGYKVLEARSGEAAIELLDGFAEPIDMLITDAVMPVIDGPALIKLVRQDRPDIRVICISGHTDESLRARVAEAGNVLFLPKPFSLKQLAQRVKERMSDSVSADMEA
jgi:two-component system cell cycle sensor histidine kinase/response regulator CckA